MPTNGYRFQEYLVFYSAPTLAHMKIGNLFRVNKKNVPNYEECLAYFNERLLKFDLHISILKDQNTYLLLYVYHKKCLNNTLSHFSIRQFLQQYGYPFDHMNNTLFYLKKRLSMEDFPHEIGIFLGYPLYDVEKFIKNKDHCKLVGYWKVYGNMKNSQKTFDRYDCCIKMIRKKISNGESLFQVISKVYP